MSRSPVVVNDDSVTISVSGGIGPQGPAGAGGVTALQGLAGALTLAVVGGTVAAAGSTITITVTGGGGSASWDDITGKPATFAPSAHTHVIADVTGLQAALDGKQAAGSYAAASHGHAATAVTYAGGALGNVTGSTVKEALDSIDTDLENRISATQFAASFSTGLSVAGGIVSVAFGATSTTACAGNDARLSDARTPTSHAHGNVTNAGAIGSTSGLIVVTGAGGVLTTAATISASAVSGLGTLATQSGTFSGTSSGVNTGDQTITLTGDVTGSGTGTFAATLSASGVTAGTYRSVTVDAKGRVTGGTNPTTLAGYGITDAAASTHQHAAGDITSGTLGIDRLPARARVASRVYLWSSFR